MATSLSVILGIIGNVIAILMFASPVGTFKQIVQKKSTENYKGIPYITTLLTTSLWTFYGLLKPGGLLVVTVNGTGAVMQSIYVALFLVYAPKDLKVKSMKLVAILNVVFPGAVILVTLVALHEKVRLTFVGIICAGLTVGMYASPLSAMRSVIMTKSVEYMPFFLSFFQFLNAGVWAAYSVLVKDYYIGVPNGVGFLLGSAQLMLYVIYKGKSSAPTNSSETMEEEDSAGMIEMKDIDEKEKNNHRSCRAGGMIHKVNSLPKPSVDRQYSRKIMKTLSLSPYQLGSPDDEPDVEIGPRQHL